MDASITPSRAASDATGGVGETNRPCHAASLTVHCRAAVTNAVRTAVQLVPYYWNELEEIFQQCHDQTISASVTSERSFSTAGCKIYEPKAIASRSPACVGKTI